MTNIRTPPDRATKRGRIYRAVLMAGKPVSIEYIASETGLDAEEVARLVTHLTEPRWLAREIVDGQYLYGPGPGPAVNDGQRMVEQDARRAVAIEEALQELLAEVMRNGMVADARINQAVRQGVEALQQQA